MTRRRARLGHADAVQIRKVRRQAFPNPSGQIFTGRIFQSLNVIEIIMVKPSMQRLKRFAEPRKIHQPTGFRINRSAHDNFYLEAVSVQATTFMVERHIRQPVRRLKSESF